MGVFLSSPVDFPAKPALNGNPLPMEKLPFQLDKASIKIKIIPVTRKNTQKNTQEDLKKYTQNNSEENNILQIEQENSDKREKSENSKNSEEPSLYTLEYTFESEKPCTIRHFYNYTIHHDEQIESISCHNQPIEYIYKGKKKGKYLFKDIEYFPNMEKIALLITYPQGFLIFGLIQGRVEEIFAQIGEKAYKIDQIWHINDICVVCWENSATVVVKPCMHKSVCEKCWDSLVLSFGVGCPICRRRVESGVVLGKQTQKGIIL